MVESSLLNESTIEGFWDDLFTWFKLAKRDFPWRNTTDPYAILIAEKLLQQTMARDYVVQAYTEIISRYPTPQELALAKISELDKIFQPLGLFFRAKHIKLMALEIVEKYDSIVPENLNDLMGLTGVGQYCARAVLSFAYGEDVPVVDTNVSRFLYRLHDIQEPMPRTPTRSKKLIRLAEEILPKGQSKDFNLAILDLCALVCKVKEPLCKQCPINKYCLYGEKTLMQNSSTKS